MSTNRKKLAVAVGQLESHLQWLKEEGVRSVAADPKILSAAPGLPAGTAARLPAAVPARPVAKTLPSAPRPVPSPAPTPGPAAPVPPLVPQPATPPPATTAAAASAALAEIAARVAVCTKCRLSQSRTRTVPGQGTPRPEIMFVGEGPGEDEDRQGLAFVGRAGQLLTRMIIRMGLTRDQVFIANIVKCRPPENRVPAPDEMAACLPYLREQVAVLQPKVIVCLGATAVKGLLNNQTGITKLRGHWQTYQGVDVMPTLHPSFLLRGGGEDRARWWEVWEDLTAVLKKVGREVPPQKTAPPA